MMKYLSAGVACAGVLCGASLIAQAAPMVGAVDTAGGYGQQVLESVLPLWQPPAGGSGFMVVSVRIGSNGEILYCDTRKSSGNQLADTAACSTVSRVGTFPAPASGMPTEVFLTLPLGGGTGGFAGQSGQSNQSGQSGSFAQTGAIAAQPGWTDPGVGPRTSAGRSTGSAGTAPYSYSDSPEVGSPSTTVQGSGSDAVPPYSTGRPGIRDMAGNAPVSGNYATTAMSLIQPHVRVPREFKGEANVVIRLGVDANGRVTGMEVEEAAGSTPAVNEAVFQAIRKAGKLPPPGVDKLMLLTFTLRGL